MTILEKLKTLKTLSELANILGYKPKGLSYILYKIPEDKKYETFEIPKKHGGKRTIQSPHTHLSVIQTRLARMLWVCVKDHQKKYPNFWFASHGFRRERTIISNAEAHKRKRFVFNLDLEDFFGTINFGRVRGFFINDRMFKLDPAVATVIAQIACYENKLPQGSPCSPIISNLIGNILDSQMLALARDTQCTYTRYADDLTFSKNKGEFPPEIAIEMSEGKWVVGEKLEHAIKTAGFRINAGKTRMSLRNSRQTVTGLVVNKKVNIKKEYYLNARAMCNSLYGKGSYHIPYDKNKTKISKLNHLEGTLSHIYFVKMRRDRDKETNKILSEKKPSEFSPPKKLVNFYEKFLFYKYFVAPTVPLIITEGSTDIAYIKRAIRLMSEQFPLFVKAKEDGELDWNIKFFNPSETLIEILNIGNGTDGQKQLIYRYKKSLARYNHNPLIKSPIIILCDNDKGAESVFRAAGAEANVKISTHTDDAFYRIFKDLYLVKIPEVKDKETVIETVIEDLFSEKLLNTKLNTKSFNYKKKINEIDENTEYGKDDFAQKVVSKATDPDDFADFIPLLKRIQGAIDDHKNKK